MKKKSVELRQATRLKIGQRIAEAGRRRLNLHDVALALGVSERTIRNWRNQAKKDAPKMGRPSALRELEERARKIVFKEMKKQGGPGWRPIAAALKGQVSVRAVQRFVSEYKFEMRQTKRPSKRMEVRGKNVIWSMDGAITNDDEKRESQVIKDRGTKCWVGLKSSRVASCSRDVIEVLDKSFMKSGKPMVLATDNGAAYKSKALSSFLRRHKVIHLKSLPRTPQHNGAVEVGIKELREIMAHGQIKLKTAIKCANNRLKIYGKKWSSPISAFENTDLLYNKSEHELFYRICSERLKSLKEESLSFKQRRLKERELIFEELEKSGLITKWKMAKNG